MQAAYTELIEHLDALEVRYEAHAAHSMVIMHLRGKTAMHIVQARIDPDSDMFQVFAFAPVVVPVGARMAVAETVVRANYGLRLGKFELDFSDGELRFQIGQVLTNGHLEGEIINRVFDMAITVLDMYMPAFLSVIYGNDLPADAVAHVEQGLPELQRDDGPAPDSLD